LKVRLPMAVWEKVATSGVGVRLTIDLGRAD
jgi:hypothetical protein